MAWEYHMKLLVVINTSAGLGDGAIYDFMRMTLKDGDEACVRYTDGTTEPSELVADAVDFDAVVISGGDGTAATIAFTLANTGVPILPFPAGTANLLANNLISPYEPRALSAMVQNGQTLDFDLGEISAQGKTYGFSIMAGAGYDAAIMHDAVPSKKRLGAAAYFQAAFANIKPQLSDITLIVDGRTIKTQGLGVILVNFSRIQFEIPITHEASARDGMFDIVILKAKNAFGLIPALFAATLDRDGGMPSRTDSLEILHGHTVEVIADPPLPIQYDGEPINATTPFKARILQGAARFLISDEAMKLFGDD